MINILPLKQAQINRRGLMLFPVKQRSSTNEGGALE